MSNIISVTGYVCNMKTFNNEGGSLTLAFSISTRTADYKRRNEESNNRDFFDVNMYVPANRVNITNYLKDKSHIQVSGVPYQEIGNDSKRYFKIKANIEMFSFISTGQQNQNNNAGQSNGQQSSAPAQSDAPQSEGANW